jgi:hypothetical protein
MNDLEEKIVCAGCDKKTLEFEIWKENNKKYCCRCYEEIAVLYKDRMVQHEKDISENSD